MIDDMKRFLPRAAALLLAAGCNLRTATYSDEQMMLGDVDGDGEVTVLDATFIQRYATKAKVPYPIGEPVNG